MTKKLTSYSSKLVTEENLLYNVGKSVSIIDLSNEKIEKVFNSLKNPSFVAISPNKQSIAYNDTIGNIAVNNVKTGELELKSKCLSKEGFGIEYLDNNRILASEWRGNIFIFNTQKNKIDVILELDESNTNYALFEDKSEFVTICNNGQKTFISNFSLINNRAKDIMEIDFILESCSIKLLNENLYVFSYHPLGIFVCSLNKAKLELIVDLNSYFNNAEDLVSRYGIFTDLNISDDKRYLCISFSHVILGFDLVTDSYIGKIQLKNISASHFLKSGQILVCTWTKISVFELSDFKR